MEIGRSPSIAPSAAATQPSSASSSQAQNVLPESQTVTPVVKADSPQLNFREVPVRTPDRSISNDGSLDEAQTAAEESTTETRFETRDREVRRELEFDRDASALIFRSIDTETGDVVQQFPEEARLNLRAYVAELEVQAERSELINEIVEAEIAAEEAAS